MLEISENRIYLTRGDSAYITISLKDNTGADYEPVAGDKIYFRLKEKIFGDKLLLVKEIDTATKRLELTPSDTSRLDFATYHYEIELVTASGDRFTVIENGEFVVGIELESHE
ncbi:MAG: hypothetical protein IJ587_11710 [Synergistaceae bacterium]|nr:hypothetical protein [Synergistaceae bacterium]